MPGGFSRQKDEDKKMLKSMTGYGRGQATTPLWDITVELRAVNHRYFEFSSRLPRTCLFLEDRLKALVQQSCARGKAELYCSLQPIGRQGTEVQVNEETAGGYITALREAGRKLGLEDDLALSALLQLPSDVFTLHRAEVDEDALWAAVQPAAMAAAAAFAAMREAEGERLKRDLSGRLIEIERLLSLVEARAPALKDEYYGRLYQKLKEVLEGQGIDESRLVTEAALFADKVAIDEETVRLRSHIDQFKALMEAEGPVGRKLDFLVQEMNRETNTIGSKCQDADIARMVVEMKSEIEKVREQIQNLE